jgi:hypothetical protein
MWYFTSPVCAGSVCLGVLAFEFVEQQAGALPSVLISTFRRPRWAMPMMISLTPWLPARLDHAVDHRDQRVAAFQREALLADVFGVQVTLQALGRGQPFEHALSSSRRRSRKRPGGSRGGRRTSDAAPESLMCMNSAPMLLE